MNKTKAHQIYKLADGTRVPGVTTILQVLNKPALVKWANNLGLQGIDSTKYRDKMADIGTLAHLMILDYFKCEKSDYSEYSPDDVDKAENCLISFYAWTKENDVKPIAVEQQLVSEVFKYGGTVDLYCMLNGLPTLVDFKTGKAIYDEMFIQVAAYKMLLEEHKNIVDHVRILRIGREDNEGFEDRKMANMDRYWYLFFHSMKIYNLQKQLKAGE